MRLVCIHDQKLLSSLLETDPYMHIYGIGDIDELFWPYTYWYGLEDGGNIATAVCIYMGSGTPTLLALSEDSELISELLKASLDILPFRFYAHLSPGLEENFSKDYAFEQGNPHYKMALTDTSQLELEDTSQTEKLSTSDIPMLLELYNDSYPGNWFEPSMLSLNRYYGIKEGEKLLSAAGTHVYSPGYRASAVGNIATRPECRGMGYGATVTAALSKQLVAEGLRVGLNVRSDNDAAVACYTKIGFSVHCSFNEYTMRRKTDN